jgi:hypothetical protein
VQREVPGAQQQAEDGQVDRGRDERRGAFSYSLIGAHKDATICTLSGG